METATRRGLIAATALMAAAAVLPWLLGWHVHAKAGESGTFPPLSAEWHPIVGPATVAAIGIAFLGWRYAFDLAASLSWPWLLALTYLAGLAWLLSLALVDGPHGISHVLGNPDEYLRTARATTDVHDLLRHWVERLPESAPGSLPTHVAGHTPGALLFFLALVRVGLGSDLVAGIVVIALAASTSVAVLLTVRRLGAESSARRAAPFLVFTPAAIWMAVSADAMFAATAAWGLWSLAQATSRRGLPMAAWASGAGLLLGWCVLMSYGLPLLGTLALAVLVAARRWTPLPIAVAAATAVVLGFLLAGFNLLEAYPVLHERYWVGIANTRPAWYWLWGDLAALLYSAGPALGAGLGALVAARRCADSAMRWLVAGAAAACLAADVSLMSKAEVERIWLPFVPWLLLSTAAMPDRWRRPMLLVQLVLALLLQHLLDTTW